MYTKGSPKYNISQLSTTGKKKASPKHTKMPSPKIRKRRSPKGVKQRAQWNAMMEKSLVEILHEHDNAYHRGQNGWSGETWNEMARLFLKRNEHVKLDKSQIQDKEKELKREYRMLKDARMQSGVGWNESEFKLEAEPHLWENLAISFGQKILKFKRRSFPLYDTLGVLYHRHTAEGHFNFTSTAEKLMKPDVTDIESDDDERETMKQKVVDEKDEDLQMLDQSEVEQVQADQRKAEVEHVKVNQRKVAGPSNSKPYKPKHSPKKSSGDGLVSVMERFVKIKENEANLEATQDFSITKCIAALRNLEGFESSEKPKAFAVFKTVENREIFLSAMDDKDGSALVWLRIEMDKLA